MAVYTHLSAEDLAALIAHYDVGELISAKGIAEGVSNSNWMIETRSDDGGTARYILTMYERRIAIDDLPYFLGLLDHLSAKGAPVPRTIHDRDGASYRMLDGKAVALIEFLPGVSVDHPTPAQAYNLGAALANMHLATADFPVTRANTLGPPGWRTMLENCDTADLAQIDPTLPDIAMAALDKLESQWPVDLPQSVIHADLFPDNVLMLGDQVAAMIDFYFACNDIAAYDLAVCHAAWCFPGGVFQRANAAALFAGYETVRPLSTEEKQALPVLASGACLRFLASRAVDWIETPAEALVTRKDPMEFAQRMAFYQERGGDAFPSVPRDSDAAP